MGWEQDLHIEDRTGDEWRLTGSKRANVEGYDPEKAGLEEGDAKFTRTFIVDVDPESGGTGTLPVTAIDSDVSIFDGELFHSRTDRRLRQSLWMSIRTTSKELRSSARCSTRVSGWTSAYRRSSRSVVL